ncbi:putative membrane-anchored protein [Desulfitispora alkaliphila]|uniref:putative cytokinetic ring protein SteA n=1 Tax=Desulfitispora alkaliphila TaxID=622674 RepID=UPI003D1FBD58
MKKITGPAKIDERTKDLVKRLSCGDIAIINHKNIDEVAAKALIEKKIAAVINMSKSIEGDYPNTGPLLILEAGIKIIDNCGKEILEKISEGEEICLTNNLIFSNRKYVACGKLLTREQVTSEMEYSKKVLPTRLEEFIDNTLEYAKKEQTLIQETLPEVRLKKGMQGRHVLIVVRGNNYREDLRAIHNYIQEIKPVIIAVDGGADAIISEGHTPDYIIGDMDSISDSALSCGAQIIVHAYANGNAPGLERIHNLSLEAEILPATGTSEDIAMLLAYEQGAELIVAVGTHSNMIDFLEKGRKGMASTLLVRMKIGQVLVDAKGVSKLYRQKFKAKYIAEIIIAALLPLTLVSIISPYTYQFFRLLYINMQMIVNF